MGMNDKAASRRVTSFLLLLLVGCGGIEIQGTPCELPPGTVVLAACKNQRADCLAMNHYDARQQCDQLLCECELQDKAPQESPQP